MIIQEISTKIMKIGDKKKIYTINRKPAIVSSHRRQ